VVLWEGEREGHLQKTRGVFIKLHNRATFKNKTDRLDTSRLNTKAIAGHRKMKLKAREYNNKIKSKRGQSALRHRTEETLKQNQHSGRKLFNSWRMSK